jgi:magnesium transporter
MEGAEKHSPQTLAVGQSPGSLTVPEGAVPTRLSVIRYSAELHDRHDRVELADLRKLTGGDYDVIWVDVTGCGTLAVFQALVDHFGLPYLAMEDHLNAPQRPKVEPYGDARFMLLRAIQVPGTVEMDQVSLFLSGRCVFTFQHRDGDCFDPIRRRLETRGSQLRQRGPDYLAYRIVDSLVDTFFPEAERLLAALESLEHDAIEHPTAGLLRRLHTLKSEMRVLERVVLPTRDAASSIARDEVAFAAETRPYLRDVHDHTQQLVEQIVLLEGLASDVSDLVFGSLNVRLTQVMKVLAAFTIVFMPLTLVTSWYGMNFRHMPELDWPWAYPAVLLLLGVIALAMLRWLRKQGWTRTTSED